MEKLLTLPRSVYKTVTWPNKWKALYPQLTSPYSTSKFTRDNTAFVLDVNTKNYDFIPAKNIKLPRLTEPGKVYQMNGSTQACATPTTSSQNNTHAVIDKRECLAVDVHGDRVYITDTRYDGQNIVIGCSVSQLEEILKQAKKLQILQATEHLKSITEETKKLTKNLNSLTDKK